MERCKTCGFWERMVQVDTWKDNATVIGPTNTGLCSCGKFVDRSGDRHQETYVKDYDRLSIYTASECGVSLWDEEGMQANFSTNEDFGCVNWKPKG